MGALCLFVAFIINSIPKQYLHNICANHTHNNEQQDGKHSHINAAVNCSIDHPFTETPFVTQQQIPLFAITYTAFTYNTSIAELYKALPQYITLRGPPALV